MKKSKFFDEQIVRILKEVEAGLRLPRRTGSTGSANRRTTLGSRSTPVWVSRSCAG